MLSSTSIVAVVFAFWELVENHFFQDLNYVTLHYLYISRGIVSSILLSAWAGWYVLRFRRQADEELHRSRERYRGLLDASPAAMVLFDEDLKISEWNATAERLYGYTRAETVGRSLTEIQPKAAAELQAFLAKVAEGGLVLDHETVRGTASGETMDVQLSLLPYLEADQRFFLEVTSDNRERVRLRQTLIEIEKLTSMGLMAAGTAHHLNTPLASMLLRIQMLRERVHDASVASDLGRLEGNITFCQQFVRRLLDFARRPSAHQQPEDITSIVDAVVSFVAPSALAKQVELVADVKGLHGVRVLGERNEIETMLLILVSNALDAVERGGKIQVRAVATEDRRVDIRVTDNGCGIKPETIPHVFEPFFTTKAPGRGTGLGLSIAMNIVKEHGGAIEVSSDPGKKTEFRVVLPLSSRVLNEVLV